MTDTTLSKFKTMSTAAIVQQLAQAPLGLTSGGKRIALVTAPQVTPTPSPTPAPAVTTTLFVNPAAQVNQYVTQYPQLAKLANQPQGIWLGNWSGNVFDYVTGIMKQAGGSKVPVFVSYNIPGRDNGNYSAGGAGSPSDYFSWVGSVGAAIGSGHAIVILEPDALGLSASLSGDQQSTRLQMISTAIDILRKQPNVKIYVDASMWVPADQMATIMRAANATKADGFSLNVSGYNAEADVESYGNHLSSDLGGMHYVVDTSRNGNGPLSDGDAQDWCNPGGRKIGAVPTSNPKPLIDAYLWVKNGGESDGSYDATLKNYSAPAAGAFYLARALDLVQ